MQHFEMVIGGKSARQRANGDWKHRTLLHQRPGRLSRKPMLPT